MAKYQLRVIEELEELKGKVFRLKVFVTGDAFKKLSVEDRALLKIQIGTMVAYKEILKLRIKGF